MNDKIRELTEEENEEAVKQLHELDEMLSNGSIVGDGALLGDDCGVKLQCGELGEDAEARFMCVIDEDGCLREYKEPYITIEIQTEEEWNKLKEAMDFWNEHHKNDTEGK